MLITVGRDVECSVVMDSPRISGRHCQIRFFADRFEVTDLGSSNGTFVGFERRRVQGPTIVLPGQPLFLGSIEVSPRDIAHRCGLQWPDMHQVGAGQGRAGGSAPTLLEGPRLHYAGFWKRVGASILDGLIVAAVSFAAFGASRLPNGQTNPDEVFRVLFSDQGLVEGLRGFLIQWAYYAVMESSPQQATLGKMAAGIKVADLHGNRLGFGRATGRYFGKTASTIICGAGYLMAAFTEKKQTLHDLMAGTLVLEKR